MLKNAIFGKIVYDRSMIKIIAGGKKHIPEIVGMILEYEKRLKKPFDVRWQFLEEKKLEEYLANWPFTGREFVILLDERGVNFKNSQIAEIMSREFNFGKEIVLIIGGAYGVTEEVRKKSDVVWSFSNLVFPHQLMRVMLIEQIYRTQEILHGGKYHHE